MFCTLRKIIHSPEKRVHAAFLFSCTTAKIIYNASLMNNQTFDVRGPQLIEFFNKHSHVRLATSRKYSMGEKVTPTDTCRSPGKRDYLFVSSIRWQPLRSNGRRSRASYGGYMLLNPRTNKLISVTNIRSLEK